MNEKRNMVEVEIRAFINDEMYANLSQFFAANGRLVEASRQITHYIDHAVDTRIQLSSRGGKIWQKLGKMHDTARRELELLCTNEQAEITLNIFANLNLPIRVSWFRKRKTFLCGEIKICLDETIGYGRIVEAEIKCNGDETRVAEKKLLDFFADMGIKPSDRETFDNAYNLYLTKWRELTRGITSKWIEVPD
jgi:adenylate cyclase class IV